MQAILNFLKQNIKFNSGSQKNKSARLSNQRLVKRSYPKILLRHSFKLDQKSALIKNIYKRTLIDGSFHLSTFGMDPLQQKFVARLLRSNSLLRFKASKYLKSLTLKKYLKNMRHIKYITIGRTEYKGAGERINKGLIKSLKCVKHIDGILFQFTFDTLDKNIVESYLKTRRHIKSLAILNQKTYSTYPNDTNKAIKPSRLPLIKMINLKELESLSLSLSDYLLKDMSYFTEFFNSEPVFERLRSFSFNISASQREQADMIVRACHKFLKKNSKITSLKLNFQNYEPLCDLVLDNFSIKLAEFTRLRDFYYSGIAECSQGIPNLFNKALDLQSVSLNLRHGNSKLCPILNYSTLENLSKLKIFKIRLENIRINRIYKEISHILPRLKSLQTLSWSISDNDSLKEVLSIYLIFIGDMFKEIPWIKNLEIKIISENLKDKDYVNLCKSFLYLEGLRDLSLQLLDCKALSDEIIIEKADLYLQMKALKYLSLDFSYRKTVYNTGLEHVRSYFMNNKGKKIEVDDEMANGKKTFVTKALGEAFRKKGKFYHFEVEDLAHVVHLS